MNQLAAEDEVGGGEGSDSGIALLPGVVIDCEKWLAAAVRFGVGGPAGRRAMSARPSWSDLARRVYLEEKGLVPLGTGAVSSAWGGSSTEYRDDEFDVADDDGLGLSDVDDLCDQDDD